MEQYNADGNKSKFEYKWSGGQRKRQGKLNGEKLTHICTQVKQLKSERG